MYTQMPALPSLPPLEAITQHRAELLCYLAAPHALFFTRQCVSVSGPLPEGRKLRGASLVKNLPAVRETWVRSLGRSLGEGNGHHSSILAWKMLGTEEPGCSPWGHTS